MKYLVAVIAWVAAVAYMGYVLHTDVQEMRQRNEESQASLMEALDKDTNEVAKRIAAEEAGEWVAYAEYCEGVLDVVTFVRTLPDGTQLVWVYTRSSMAKAGGDIEEAYKDLKSRVESGELDYMIVETEVCAR